jgi:ABC-type glycerol-3-phosphate transport system substrate-binding protein
MRLRKFASVPVFVALLFTLLAVAPGAAQEVTTITWLTLDWPVDDVIAQFEADNPDIKIEVEQVPFNDLFTQIQVRFGAGSTTPDVIAVDAPLVASYALRGWLLPLEEEFSEEDFADWLPSAIEAGSIEG